MLIQILKKRGDRELFQILNPLFVTKGVKWKAVLKRVLPLDFFLFIEYTACPMKFKNQLAIIETLIQGDEVDTRIDCPFCNHSNTLTIKKENGKLLWYCFHASCSAKGNAMKEISMPELLSLLSRKKNNLEKKEFTIPKSFISIFSTEKCTDYFKKNHCMEAYIEGRADMRYDVKQHRAVFIIKNKKKIYGAIGRGLNSQVYPKWFIYGDKQYPFICGQSDIGVLVEDCASACAVSHVYSGIALMGTSLPDSYISIIKKRFTKLIVALDRDATIKAFDISNKLRYYIDTKVKILEDDLKYYDKETVKKILA